VNTNTNVNVKKDVNVNRNVHVAKLTQAISLKGVDSLRQPLVLVDGITKTITALNAIPKGKITSIDVLKAADATSLYGSKAANGVIIVRTIDGAKQ
jgi:TonB-dependent SusC/RagA subfamily outer membrane receptor